MTGFSGDPMAWNKLRALKNVSKQQVDVQYAILQQLGYQSQLLFQIYEMMRENHAGQKETDA